MNLQRRNDWVKDRIPPFLGTFEEILRNRLQQETWLDGANDEFLHVYNTGLLRGDGIGYNRGVGVGVKSVILGGRRQLLIDHEKGAVYAFGSVDEIHSDKNTRPLVKDFLAQQTREIIPKAEQEYQESLDKVKNHKSKLELQQNIGFANKIRLTDKYEALDKDSPNYELNEKKRNKLNDEYLYELGEKIEKDGTYRDITHEDLLKDEILKPITKQILEKANSLGYNTKQVKNPVKLLNVNKAFGEVIEKEIIEYDRDSTKEFMLLKKEIEDLPNKDKDKKRELRIKMRDLKKDNTKTMSELRDKKYLNDELRKEIERSMELYNAKYKKKHLQNYNEHLHNYEDPSYKNASALERDFRVFRPGNKTPMFKSDKITLVDIPLFQKIVNPNKKDGLVNASDASYNIADKLVTTGFQDYRSEPGHEQRTMDYLNFPDAKPVLITDHDGILAVRKTYKK